MSDFKNNEPDSYPCDVDYCTLFRVYCAVEVPPSRSWILDDIILSSRRGLLDIEDHIPGPYEASCALLFWYSDPPGSTVKSGSHVPLMVPFPSYPLAGKSLQQIYDYHRGLNELFVERMEGGRYKCNIAFLNFAVVDKRTLIDGTILLCSDATWEWNGKRKKPMPMHGDTQPIPEGLATLRSDGFCSLPRMNADELGTGTLRNAELQDSFVETEEYSQAMELEYIAGVQAKIARGERLRPIEVATSGLKDPLASADADE